MNENTQWHTFKPDHNYMIVWKENNLFLYVFVIFVTVDKLSTPTKSVWILGVFWAQNTETDIKLQSTNKI